MADRDSGSCSRSAVAARIVEHASLDARGGERFDSEDLIVDEVADADNSTLHEGLYGLRFPSCARQGHLGSPPPPLRRAVPAWKGAREQYERFKIPVMANRLPT